MKVIYYGYFVIIVEMKDYYIIFDLFLIGNLLMDVKLEDVKVDVILLMYGYNDYVGDIE